MKKLWMGKTLSYWDWQAKRDIREDAECYGDGDYCVYFWQIDDTGEVFYVGSGKKGRYHKTTPSQRSEEFLRIIEKHRCHPEIAAYGMTKKQARDFEKQLAVAYSDLGFHLVNEDAAYAHLLVKE